MNLTGTFNLTRLAVKHLINVPAEEGADGERGVIIMVGSTVAVSFPCPSKAPISFLPSTTQNEGQQGQIAYAASKGAIRSMTLPMARDLSRHSIRVVTISPSPFITPMTSQFTPATAHNIQSQGLLFPKRYGLPCEFAKTVRWILECPYVNGETIDLTGGTRVPMPAVL